MNYGVEALSQSDVRSPIRSRVVLVLIFALFALPLTVAWVMNFTTDWVPQATTNHGELIDPVRPFDVAGLVDLSGTALDDKVTANKWTLVYLLDGECADACHNVLYVLRQVRLAQSKNIDRVARLTIINDLQVPAWASEAQAHYPGMQLAVPRSVDDAALAVFPEPNQIYILDPLGNLMMRYPLTVEPHGMIKDLERLLRISYVG